MVRLMQANQNVQTFFAITPKVRIGATFMATHVTKFNHKFGARATDTENKLWQANPIKIYFDYYMRLSVYKNPPTPLETLKPLFQAVWSYKC